MPTTNIYNNTNIQQEHSPIEIKSVFGQGTTGVGSFNGRQGDVIVLQSDITNALGYTPQNALSEQVRADFTFTGTTVMPGGADEILTVTGASGTRPAISTSPTTTTPTFNPTTSNTFRASAIDSDGNIMAWDGTNLYYSEDGGATFSNSGVTFDVALPSTRTYSAMGVIPGSPSTWVFIVGQQNFYSSGAWAIYTSTDRRAFAKMTDVQSDAYFSGWGSSIFPSNTQIPFNGTALQMTSTGTDISGILKGYLRITPNALTADVGVPGGTDMYSSAFNGSVLISCGYSGAIQTASSTNTSITNRTSGTTRDLLTAASLGNVTICAGASNTVVANTDGTGASWSAQTTGATGSPFWLTSTVDRANNRIILYGGSGWRAVCTVTGSAGNYTLTWSASQISGNNYIGTAVRNASTATENVFGTSGAACRRLAFPYPSLTATQPQYTQNATTYPALSVTYQTTGADSEQSIINGLWSLISPLRPLWTAQFARDGSNNYVATIDTNSNGNLPDTMLATSGSFSSGSINLTATQGGIPNDVITFTDPVNGNLWQYTVAQGQSLEDIVGNLAFLEELDAYYLQQAAISTQGIIVRATRFATGALASNQILNATITNGAGSTLAVVRRVLSAGA